jgi:hypothetical protein
MNMVSPVCGVIDLWTKRNKLCKKYNLTHLVEDPKGRKRCGIK